MGILEQIRKWLRNHRKLRRVCAWCEPMRLLSPDGRALGLAGPHQSNDSHGICSFHAYQFLKDAEQRKGLTVG